MRTIYLGTSDIAAGILKHLAGTSHRPQLVITRPDRPKGRGRKVNPPPVANAAQELGIDLIQPEKLHDEEVLDLIRSYKPERVCVCAYGVIIKEPLLSEFELINVHFSLLPRWRGAAPIERAIMAGDPETGISIMQIAAGLDTGAVYMQQSDAIRADDDYGTLGARLQQIGSELLVRVLEERPEPTEQEEEFATVAPKITADDRLLDPTRSPEEVERVVRALHPHVGARIGRFPNGEFLGVVKAQVDGQTLLPEQGRLRSDIDRLYFDCNGGSLELLEIKPPGSRPMAAAEWLRGRPDPVFFDAAPVG